MVRIINYKKRVAENKEFFVLEVSGGIEMVLSKTTGMYYATSKKATITSTFDEETSKSLIGSEFPGSIVKEECEPYEYTIHPSGNLKPSSADLNIVKKLNESCKLMDITLFDSIIITKEDYISFADDGLL